MPRRLHLALLLAVLPVALLVWGCQDDPDAELTVVAPAVAPIVAITAPESGSIFAAGDTIRFAAIARDLEDAHDELTAVFRSDQSGELATVAPDAQGHVHWETAALAYATHVVTLEVRDSDGHVRADSVVVNNDLPPRPMILEVVRHGDTARITWSQSPVDDVASYRLYRTLDAGEPGPEDLLLTVDAPTDTVAYDPEPILGVTQWYWVEVVNEPGRASLSVPATFLMTNIDLWLSVEVTDAIMHPDQPYLYLTDKDRHRLYWIDVATQTVRDSVQFDHMVESLAIRETGGTVELYVALLAQNHSSYWWEEDQEGWVAVLDADDLTPIATHHILTDPYDLVMGRDDHLYVPSGSGQWTDFSSFALPGFALADQAMIRQRSEARMHPTLDRIYTMDSDVSPRDIEAYDVVAGQITGGHDSPYHGTYSMGHPFGISPDGTFLITASGTIFACDANVSNDLQYLHSTGRYFDAVAFAADRQRFYTVDDTYLTTYAMTGFGELGTQLIEGFGRFLFYRGDHLVAVVDPPNDGSAYDSGLEIIPLEDDE
jgi:hypothetical protein